MKHYFVAILLILSPMTSFCLSEQDEKTITELTRDYVRWNMSGWPADFHKKLDIESHLVVYPYLIEIAELEWEIRQKDIWGKKGVESLEALKKLPKDKLVSMYHDRSPFTDPGAKEKALKMDVDIHTMTEARGLVYVTYTLAHSGDRPTKDAFYTIRFIDRDGVWFMYPQLSIENWFIGYLENLKIRKGLKKKES